MTLLNDWISIDDMYLPGIGVLFFYRLDEANEFGIGRKLTLRQKDIWVLNSANGEVFFTDKRGDDIHESKYSIPRLDAWRPVHILDTRYKPIKEEAAENSFLPWNG